MKTLNGHKKSLFNVKFSPDGKNLITSSQDRTCKLWNIEGIEIWTYNSENQLYSASFSPNGEIISIITKRGQLHLLNPDRTSIHDFTKRNFKISKVFFSSDSKYMLLQTNNSVNLLPIEPKSIETEINKNK